MPHRSASRPGAPALLILLALLGSTALAGVACGETEETPATDETPVDDASDVADGPWSPPPARACNATAAWDGEAPLFRDATADWGLDTIGAVGVRVNVADIDGDGWPDLLLRRGGTRPESLDGSGARSTWLLRNDGGRGFVDVTVESGLVDLRAPVEGIGRPVDVPAFADVDNDGDLDVYTGVQTADSTVTAASTSELMRNDGQGFFTFTRDDNALRAADRVDSPAGATFIDVNRDGNIDLWIAQHGYTAGGSFTFAGDRLFLGRGDGTFEEATDAMGLATVDWAALDDIDAARAHSRAWSSVACDLDNDGWPELLAASYGRAPNHLWHARPSEAGVTYENVSVASGYAFDENQAWQDNQFARCHCASFPADEGCEGAPAPQIQCSPNWSHGQDRRPFRLGGNSGTTLCVDLDNDGFLDLVTTEIRHWWAGEGSDGSAILYNTGESPPRFTRPDREATGMTVPLLTSGSWDEGHITATAFDVDNDGRLDLYIGASEYPGNRGLLYLQGNDGRFRLVPPSLGIEHNRSHGVAFADLDRDGDLDLIVGHSHSRCDANAPTPCYPTQQFRIFENIRGDAGNWVQLRLEGGPGTNRAAIGARVTLTTPDGLVRTHEVGGGHGHYGTQDDLVVHMGLGAHCEGEVTIRWPDAAGSTSTFAITSGHFFHVRQGDDPTQVELSVTR